MVTVMSEHVCGMQNGGERLMGNLDELWVTDIDLALELELLAVRLKVVIVHVCNTYTYLPSHYITVAQIQYILIISIAWEFATN